MASGNALCLFHAQDGVPPASTYATGDRIAGGSTPAESVPVLDFDQGSDEFIDFYGVLPATYSGGGLTITLMWSASSATSGNVVWGLAFRRVADDAEQLSTSHSYSYNEVTDAAPSALTEVAYATITFTNGADMDDLAAGEMFILRCRRNGDDAGDTMSGDAELHFIYIRET